jgi:hypothetical protein
MCRSIKNLRAQGQAPTDLELQEAALQFVRKISGYRVPSKSNEAAFQRAVVEVAMAGRRLFDNLQIRQIGSEQHHELA